MYLRAEDRSRYYYDQSADARARVEELEGQLAARVAQDEQRQTALVLAQAQVEELQQRLAEYEPQVHPVVISSELEEMEEPSVPDAHSAA